ncbi:MAG: (2Fe-2S) ferredoxin domain-containing protein [Bacteroidales bacterium]|nr:(2Fe-2S) ferredoxin domain-containing protein [Bacteroidales bacterium]
MTKVKSLEELKKLREAFQQQIKIRHQGDTSESKTQIRVAMATCGIASGAKAVMEYFIEELDKRNVDAVVMQTGCMGYCYAEPTVEITKPGEEPIVFGWVDEKKADAIIEKYIKQGELVEGIIPKNYDNADN